MICSQCTIQKILHRICSQCTYEELAPGKQDEESVIAEISGCLHRRHQNNSVQATAGHGTSSQSG